MGLSDPLPRDWPAEAAVIGDMVQAPGQVGEIAPLLTPEDFSDRRCGVLFSALVAGWRNSRPVDAVGLADVLRAAGYEPDGGWLHDVVTSGSAAWRTHVDVVLAMRARRQLLAVMGEGTQEARSPDDPWELIDTLKARLAAIERPTTEPPPDLCSVDEFIDRPDSEESDWVVEGLLRRGWRCMVVGAEGGGKSMLFRQFAVLSGQGIHPLRFQPIPPIRSLLIDLENPEDNIKRSCRALRERVDPKTYEFDRAWLWHRPAGIDIRSRVDRGEFEAAVAAVRPDLLCIGPAYKLYRRRHRETDEEAALDVQAIFDDLRTRYGFALLIEHHAGQDVAGHREYRPYGSSLWRRWPELGLGLEPDERNKHRKSITVKRWRGDRMANDWPDYLDQGDKWPWLGVWRGSASQNVIEFPAPRDADGGDW